MPWMEASCVTASKPSRMLDPSKQIDRKAPPKYEAEMHLKRVEISNFRSIESCNIEFHKRFQTLLGINEAGKSNILSALALIDESIEIDADDLREISPDEEPLKKAHVWFVFGLSQAELSQAFQEVRKLILCKEKNPAIVQRKGNPLPLRDFVASRTETLYCVDLLNRERSKSYWSLAADTFSISSDWKCVIPGKSGEAVPGDPATDISNFEIVNAKDYPNLEPSSLKDLNLYAFNRLVGRQIHSTVALEHPECVLWRYDENNLLPGRIGIAGFKANPDSCVPLKIMFALAGHTDIAGAIDQAESRTNGMRNLLDRVGDKTTEHLRSVWPEWKELRVEVAQNGEHIEAGIEDRYNFYSLQRRSDGFKRFFTFLLMLSAKNKASELRNNLILIDEPEIGLHPSGQSYLLEELAKISENNLVVISTHSIFMIDREKVDRHIVVKKRNEITTISRPEKSLITDEEVLFQALGFSIYEILKKCNIIFEGWRDKKVFETFAKKRGALTPAQKAVLANLGLLHAIGVKDISRVANMCENLGRDYIILTDSDNIARQKKHEFQGSGEWLTYADIPGQNGVTTEDYLTTDAINRALERTLAFHGLKLEQAVDLSAGVDRITIIDRALSTIPGIDRRQIMNNLKEEVITSLKPSDIGEGYKAVVEHLINNITD